jgi:TPR repeat protein
LSNGGPNELIEAARYFKLSADQGLACGQYAFADCLRKGIGISINCVEATGYLRRAADAGLAVAQFDYGLCLGLVEVFRRTKVTRMRRQFLVFFISLELGVALTFWEQRNCFGWPPIKGMLMVNSIMRLPVFVMLNQIVMYKRSQDI